MNRELPVTQTARRTLLASGAIIMSAITAGCGQTSPPSPEQIRNDAKVFELKDVTAANGEPVRCVEYGSDSYATQNSKSWFGFACDFQGTAHFPGEPQPAPTSTTTTTTLR